MRTWLLGTCAVLVLAVFGPVSAMAEVHKVQVLENEFSPRELTIKPGDTVQWTWVAGSYTIHDGDPLDENEGQIINFAISEASPKYEQVFTKTGVYPYFSIQKATTMTGIITVQESTPVEEATWGWLKTVFEGGLAPRLRN